MRTRRPPPLLYSVAAMLAVASATAAVARADPTVTLGASDELAIDQPLVPIEVFDPATGASMGPSVYYNYPFYLDTGAQGILVVSTAVDELAASGYQTCAKYDETGVGGLKYPYDVSLPYNLDFAGTDLVSLSLRGVRMMSDPATTLPATPLLSMWGYPEAYGVVGTPAMVNRVTSLNQAAVVDNWTTMDVAFSSRLPAASGHRYSVPLSVVSFPATGRRDPNDPLPTYGPLLLAPAEVRFGAHAEANAFIIDSGAQMSLLSTAVAFRLGLDTNGDGNLWDEAIDTATFQGAGGTVTAPVLQIDSLRLKTKENVDLAWTDCRVAVVDIDPNIAGVIGWDLMTSGYIYELLEMGTGYVRQVHVDLRKPGSGTGTLYLDIDPGLDAMWPGPMRWNVSGGNWGDGNNWISAEPNAGLLAIISNGGTATISQGPRACLTMLLGFSPGESGAVSMTGGGLSCGQVFVGYRGAGSFAQSGGEHRIDGDLYLGHFAGAFGAYHLSDGNLVVGGNVYVGYDGDGAFSQVGGRHVVGGRLNIGYYPDSNGAYTLSGGELIVPRISIGPKALLRLAGGGLRADPADASLRTDVVSEGLLHVADGNHALGELLVPDANLLRGAVVVEAGASLTARRIVQQDATVGGTLRLQGPSKTTSVLNALNIAGAADAWTGTVDIMNNALVVQSGTGPDANAAYARLVNQARLASANLMWSGAAGVTSTLARGDGNTAVAVVLNRDDLDLGSPAFMSSFDATPDANQAVAVNTFSVLVKYTWYGDADLNGVVDERDLTRFSTGYSDQRSPAPVGLSGWAWGDFDNNGTIDERDLTLFSAVYSNHGGPLSPGAVPEPGTMVLLICAGMAATGRRGSALRR